MRVFPRKTTDYIAEQFCNYFQRKLDHRMTIREAKTLIDFVSGPSPAPQEVGATDYSSPRVSGGGTVRPTESQVEEIFQKYEDTAPWDAVFDDLLRQCKEEPTAVEIIHMAFRDGKRESEICEKLNISPKTYYNYRITILVRAAVLATVAGNLEI